MAGRARVATWSTNSLRKAAGMDCAQGPARSSRRWAGDRAVTCVRGPARRQATSSTGPQSHQEAELEAGRAGGSTPAPQLRENTGPRPELKWCPGPMAEGAWAGGPGEAAQGN